jgi:hypothetical protein
MSTVLVHSITVTFESGEPQVLDPDHVAWMRVHYRKLKLGHGLAPNVMELLQRAAERDVVAVTFVYTGQDGVDRSTTVSAIASDDICYGWPGHWPGPPMQRVGKLVPADLLAGEFAVTDHRTVALEQHSKEGEVGWHDPDCTWYYPR